MRLHGARDARQEDATMATLRRKSSGFAAVACLAVGTLACGSDSPDVGTASMTRAETESLSTSGTNTGVPSSYVGANYYELRGGGLSVEYGPVGGATRLIYRS